MTISRVAPEGLSKDVHKPGISNANPWSSFILGTPVGLRLTEGFSKLTSGSFDDESTADAEESCTEHVPQERLEFEANAASILRVLAPEWMSRSSALERLESEQLQTSLDIARLDKADLCELGLSMAERSRVLEWSRVSKPDCEVVRNTKRAHSIHPSFQMPDADSSLSHFSGTGTTSPKTPLRVPNRVECLSDEWMRNSSAISNLSDDIKRQAEFWCSCFTPEQTPSPMLADCYQEDIRERLLEASYDCTLERLTEVFASMGHGVNDELESVEELEIGLERCGLSHLDHNALEKVFQLVTKDGGSLTLDVFESILSRLRLASELRKPIRGRLDVVDYTYSKASKWCIDEEHIFNFCFGHRPAPKLAGEGPVVRWVHMHDFDLRLLLMLSMKYGLHPLSVEDVIEQCATKLDHFGHNYFLAIELLSVVHGGDGKQPVLVNGHHVTAFCAGPPALDTMLTIAQADQNFVNDWPGACSRSLVGAQESSWPKKLEGRLLAARSRLREKRADFLFYTLIDLCADELRSVTRAFFARLAWLEEDLRAQGERSLLDLGEVGFARLQLTVVARRLRGLQRVVRRASEYEDLQTTGSLNYWKDCADHLEEAVDDAFHISDRYEALKSAHDQVMERSYRDRVDDQHEITSRQAERMNRLLCILTVATAIFTPMTFMTGVFGMNFQTLDGAPNVDGLLDPDGYHYFAIACGIYLVVSILLSLWLYCRVKKPPRNPH